MIRVEELLADVATSRVCIVGDLLLDAFSWGRTERLSPEAPVPVVVEDDMTYRAGGVATAAQPLLSLGAAVHVVTAIGRDVEGEKAVALLRSEGGSSSAHKVGGRRTPRKTRVMADGRQLVRIDRETVTDLPPDAEVAVIEAARESIAVADAVLVSDYGKGVCTPEVTRAVITAARSARVPVVVDPKRADPSHYAGATVLTPNRHELTRLAGDDSAEAARRLRSEAEVDWVMATRSADGLLAVGASTEFAVPAYAQQVEDVAGAGDALAAVLAAALGAGRSMVEAAELASLVAGLTMRSSVHKRVAPNEVAVAARLFGVTEGRVAA